MKLSPPFHILYLFTLLASSALGRVDLLAENQTTTTSTLSLFGTNSSEIVGSLIWSNELNEANGTVTAGSSWTIDSVPLTLGTNLLRVVGTKADDSTQEDHITVVRKIFSGNIYYIDSESGDDSATGTNPATPWKSLAKANAVVLGPGDQLLFKAASEFSAQQLWPQGGGAADAPVLISRYGNGADPKFDGTGLFEATVWLENFEYVEVEHLDIANLGNTSASNNEKRRGLVFRSTNYGTVRHVHLHDLFIHDVNGCLIKKKGEGVGLLMQCDGAKPSNFDDILIENCRLERCDRNGIDMKSSFYQSDSYDPETQTRSGGNWFPSSNVVIRANTLLDIGGDGIKIIACDGTLVESNLVSHAVQRCSDAAAGIWPWSADNTLIQYNEVCYLKDNQDGMSFDADDNCSGVIFQYNYSHDNGGGFFLIIGVGDSMEPGSIGLHNTIIRYNISENDGDNGENAVFRIDGNGVHDVEIYNNTVYLPSGSDLYFVDIPTWAGIPIGQSRFHNNIVITEGILRNNWSDRPYTNVLFESNIFFGNIQNLPSGTNRITSDPQLEAPGRAKDGVEALCAYLPKAGSPAIDSGVSLPNPDAIDILKTPVPYNGTTDRGACEFAAQSWLVARSDCYSTFPDTTFSIEAEEGLRNNDLAIRTSAPLLLVDSAPTNGWLFVSTDGSFSYTPAPSLILGDSFSYRLISATITSSVATVTIQSKTNQISAYWTFNETHGTTAADSSGNRHDATLLGGTWTNGYDKGGISLIASDKLTVLDPPTLSENWTIGMRAYVPTPWIEHHEDILRSDGRANIALHNWENGKVAFGHPGKADWEFNYTLPVGEWVHLTFVAEGTLVNLFTNGTYAANIDTQEANACPTEIIGNGFIGRLDDLRIIPRSLNASEVQTLAEGTLDYNDWILKTALSGSDADPMADPDGDGVCNFSEFAFAMNPEIPDAPTNSALIALSLEDQLLYRVSNLRDGVEYRVETSTDLLSNSWKFYTRLIGKTGGHSATIFIPADPDNNGTNRFIRTQIAPLP